MPLSFHPYFVAIIDSSARNHARQQQERDKRGEKQNTLVSENVIVFGDEFRKEIGRFEQFSTEHPDLIIMVDSPQEAFQNNRGHVVEGTQER